MADATFYCTFSGWVASKIGSVEENFTRARTARTFPAVTEQDIQACQHRCEPGGFFLPVFFQGSGEGHLGVGDLS